MLGDGRFWFGVIVGVGGTYAYHRYARRGAPAARA